MNGRKSAGKRSQEMNICYFFITDQAEKGNMEIEHCPTDGMVADLLRNSFRDQSYKSSENIYLGCKYCW